MGRKIDGLPLRPAMIAAILDKGSYEDRFLRRPLGGAAYSAKGLVWVFDGELRCPIFRPFLFPLSVRF